MGFYEVFCYFSFCDFCFKKKEGEKMNVSVPKEKFKSASNLTSFNAR